MVNHLTKTFSKNFLLVQLFWKLFQHFITSYFVILLLTTMFWSLKNMLIMSKNIITFFVTNVHFTGDPFLHGLENRVENPENLQISNKHRNRASWRILSKPTPNGSSRTIFSEKIMISKFSTILLWYIGIWTSTRSGFAKISKNT